MQKERRKVYVIGNPEEDDGVLFVPDLQEAEEVWIYTQQEFATDSIFLSPRELAICREKGLRIMHKSLSLTSQSELQNIKDFCRDNLVEAEPRAKCSHQQTRGR